LFQINAGSLSPAFQRFERQGLIEGEWRSTENNRRAKYYLLTGQRRKKLKAETRDWRTQIAPIARTLEATSGEL
jgi:PadR family transcriptional regulator PadR